MIEPLIESPVGNVTPIERRRLLGAVWCACVVYLCGVTIADPDLWGHTLYGLRALAQGVFAERTDPFSYTAPRASWVNHEWLTEMIYGELWRTFGSAGLVMWRNLLVILLFVVFGKAMRAGRASIGGGVLLLIFTTECLANFVVFVRPQLATFVLFGATLLLFRGYWDRRSRVVWCCVPLMALWTNLHGGFLAGIAIAGLFVAAAIWRAWRSDVAIAAVTSPVLPLARTEHSSTSRDWHRQSAVELTAVFAAMCAATFVNPYGAELHHMLWHHLVTDQFVREWQPLWGARQSIVYYVPFLLGLFALVRSRRWHWIDLCVLLFVGWQAMSHLRHVALLAIAVGVLLPAALTDALRLTFARLSDQWARADSKAVRVAAVAGVLVVLGVLQIRGSKELWKHGIPPWEVAVETRSGVPGVPTRAAIVMRQLGLSGNLITDYGWGQYALWQMYPTFRVAFDGRYRTIYSADLESEFLAFQRAGSERPARTPMLDTHQTDVALLPVDGGPDRYLRTRNDWVCLYRDDQAAVYVARDGRFANVVRECADRPRAIPEMQLWVAFPARTGGGTAVASGSMEAPGDRLVDAIGQMPQFLPRWESD